MRSVNRHEFVRISFCARRFDEPFTFHRSFSTVTRSRKGAVVSLSCKIIPSPIGRLRLVASDEGLAAILWDNDRPLPVHLADLLENPAHPTLLCAEKELNEYFSRNRKTFSVTLDMRGTHFQKQVWEALLAIPFGETRSYGQIANQLGNPKATRAVGAANGQNPIPIIVPCHRVIGANGKLTGFGGGLEIKDQLLALEGVGRTLFG
jgi:methylated-DNA-[protein]-cysteine S-methyltransferase